MCVCVCVRARARACACVYVCAFPILTRNRQGRCDQRETYTDQLPGDGEDGGLDAGLHEAVNLLQQYDGHLTYDLHQCPCPFHGGRFGPRGGHQLHHWVQQGRVGL